MLRNTLDLIRRATGTRRAITSRRPTSGPYQVAHVTVVHRPTDNRIMRKECAARTEGGVKVILLAVADRDSTVDGVHIRALPRRSGRIGRMLLGPVDAWRQLRIVRPSLIHVHDPELIPLAVVWRLWPGRRAVYDAHEDFAKQVVGKRYIPRPILPIAVQLARLLEVIADRSLDAIVVATPSIGSKYCHARVVLVQNFPWLRDFPEPSGSTTATPDEVAYVGALTLDRGLDVMISGVKESRHGPRLVLAGPADVPATKLLQAEAPDHVTYAGLLPPTEVPAILARSRVGLVVLRPLPNYVASQPTKLFEYMAAGRPFIASDFPYWRRMLESFDCGLFIDPRNPTELAAAIDTLLDDPSRAGLMGARGRAAIEEHFTFEHQTAALLKLTRDLSHV